MRIFPYLALLWQSGALFTRPPIEKIYDVIITPLTTTSTASSSTYAVATLSQSRDASTTTFSYSTLITMAPVSRNPLELRQRCFDDRGFSVDCATWTGYYYTWGPPSDPYNDGSGASGTTNYTGSANKAILPIAVCYIILMNILTLWAALSL